jgi:hypothetical protein
MVGRAIRKGEQFDTEVLLGQPYHIMVTNTPEDERGRVYDNVVNVHCIRPKAELKQEKAGKPEASEGESLTTSPGNRVSCGGSNIRGLRPYKEYK